MKKYNIFVFSLIALAFLGFFGVRWIHAQYYPPILMYHSLTPGRADTPGISPQAFARQMEFIKRHGYRVISLEELVRELKQSRKPRKTVVITFDDGYKDNLKAVKILNKYNFPAIIFMIAGYVGKHGYLTKTDLRWIETSGRVRIGAHTVTHAYLPECKDYVQEIKGAKQILERLLGHKVGFFSYPIGGFNRDIQRAVKQAGYICAVTTNRGYERNIDIYALRRIKIKETDQGLKLYLKLSGYYNLLRSLRRPE